MQPGGTRMNAKVETKKRINWNDLAIVLILLVLIVILAIIKPVFLSAETLLNIMRQVTIVAILGIGMSYVLICLLYTSFRFLLEQ